MRVISLLFSALMLVLAVNGHATETIHAGGFPTSAGPVLDEVNYLYNIIFIIIAVIGVGVAAGMLYIIVNFRRSKRKQAAKFSHNLGLELLWTVIPAIICVYIAYISYEGLHYVRTIPKGALTVEVVAYQFGWDFFYPDASENGVHVSVPEASGPDKEISAAGVERSTKELVVPVGKPVVVHLTSSDVIHAFFVPELGIKMDAMPGRINYVWFQADKAGSYLGQCAELCGSAHGEMFFRVKAVPQAEFDAFIMSRRLEAGLTAEKAAPSDPLLDVSGTVPVNVSTTDVSTSTGASISVTTHMDVVSATQGASNTEGKAAH